MERLRAWFFELESKRRTQLVFSLAGLVAVGVWLAGQESPPETPEIVQEQAVTVSGVIQVHVVGEVQTPNLYSLDIGSRVSDAISAAGGFTEKAIQHSVNLARTLSDGEQIVVLGPSDLADSMDSGLVSINRADAQQLDTLPGVGPALAARILALRTELGSFSDVRQLREVSGIGEKLFSSIKDLVTL